MDIFRPPTYLFRLVNVVCERLQTHTGSYKLNAPPKRSSSQAQTGNDDMTCKKLNIHERNFEICQLSLKITNQCTAILGGRKLYIAAVLNKRCTKDKQSKVQ